MSSKQVKLSWTFQVKGKASMMYITQFLPPQSGIKYKWYDTSWITNQNDNNVIRSEKTQETQLCRHQITHQHPSQCVYWWRSSSDRGQNPQSGGGSYSGKDFFHRVNYILCLPTAEIIKTVVKKCPKVEPPWVHVYVGWMDTFTIKLPRLWWQSM